MKTKTIVLSAALLLAATSLSYAQDTDQPAGGPPPPGNHDGQHRPHNPLLALFDTNHDGVIDATEIANAPAVLRALDKNGDGQLTADELRPPRGPKGKDGGPGGKGGEDLPPPPPDDAK